MRRYKILARILLILSVVDFAPAAPVVVQEHEVRVSVVDAAKDGTATSPLRRDPYKWLANAMDQTNLSPIARSSDSDHWREQEPRQHNPRSRRGPKGSAEPSNPAPPIDLYANNPPNQSPPPGPGSTSPSPSSRAPTDESDPLSSSSPDHDSHTSNPTSPSDSSPGSSYDNLDAFPQPNSLKFKSLSEVVSPPDEPYSSSSREQSDTNSGSTSSPGLSQDHAPSPPSSPTPKFKYLSELMTTTTPVSSSDESYSSSSWVKTDTDSGSTSSTSSLGLSQDHAPSPPSNPTPKFKSVSELMTTTTSVSSSDKSFSSSSWVPTDAGSDSKSDHLPSDSLPTAEYYLGSAEDQSSTGESHPLTPGPTDSPPSLDSSLNPGPSTERNPPPSTKRPRPDEFGSFVSKIVKGKLKRRFSGSGPLNVATGGLAWYL